MKDKRLQIYCASTFFMHVFRRQKELSSEGELSRNIFSLFRHSKVNVEAESSEILRKTVPQEILLAYPTIGLHPNQEDFALIEKGDPSFFLKRISSSSLFFLDSEEEKCVLLEQRFGIVCISLHKFHKARFLFSWHLESIFRGNNIFDWTFLNRYQHPHNALLISDNYLFSELTRPKAGLNAVSERIENDIIPIVDALLPTHLNEETFQLTIIFVQDIEEAKEKNEATRNGIRDNRPKQTLEEIAKAIECALQNLRRKRLLPKKIELSLVKRFSNVNRSQTHDRHVGCVSNCRYVPTVRLMGSIRSRTNRQRSLIEHTRRFNTC